MEKSESPKEEPKEANWDFHPENQGTADTESTIQPAAHETISWSASEFVGHDKTFAWFLASAIVIIAIAGVVFFATGQSWFSSVLVLIAGATFVFFAAQPPRVLEYSVDASGLTIAGKMFEYHRFKSFSVIHEGAINSIALQPLERFMPSISLYYEPKDEKKIAEVLGIYLPYEERQLAQVDKLMRKIRF